MDCSCGYDRAGSVVYYLQDSTHYAPDLPLKMNCFNRMYTMHCDILPETGVLVIKISFKFLFHTDLLCLLSHLLMF